MASTNNIENLKNYNDIYDPQVQAFLVEEIRAGANMSDVLDVIMTIDEDRRTIQRGLYNRLKGKPASKEEWKEPKMADGIPVLARKSTDGKVNYKSHTPFDRTIVQNKASYFVGIPPDVNTEENSKAEEWIKDNSLRSMISELAQDASGQGEGFLLLYSPEGTDEALISKYQSYNCVVLYDQDTELPAYGLIYFIDLVEGGDELIAYWYDMTEVSVYKGSQGSMTLQSTELHLFENVPLVEFPNNTERMSDTETVIALMDIYDFTDSDFVSELGQLRLAYLLLKGMGLSNGEQGDFNTSYNETFDAEYHPGKDGFNGLVKMNMKTIVEEIKKSGVFLTDEKGEASFVQKNINYEAIQYAKESLKERIFQMAGSYDPNALSTGNSSQMTAFQIQMRLFGIINSSNETEQQFRRSLSYMFKLLGSFYGEDWDLEIEFKQNIPSNILADMKDYRMAGGQLSQKQLMKNAPFPINQEENLAELQEEQTTMLIGVEDATEQSNEE